MKEIFANGGTILVEMVEVVFDDLLISSMLLVPLALAPFLLIVKMMIGLMGDVHFSFGSAVVEFFCWLGRKIVDLMCCSEYGFTLAYKLGWAKAGVHFFDCGVDCDKCPKYAECTEELRVVFDSKDGDSNV